MGLAYKIVLHKKTQMLSYCDEVRSNFEGQVKPLAILMLTSPVDINAPTRSPLVFLTKASFVSLVTNLNKNNVC